MANGWMDWYERTFSHAAWASTPKVILELFRVIDEHIIASYISHSSQQLQWTGQWVTSKQQMWQYKKTTAAAPVFHHLMRMYMNILRWMNIPWHIPLPSIECFKFYADIKINTIATKFDPNLLEKWKLQNIRHFDEWLKRTVHYHNNTI